MKVWWLYARENQAGGGTSLLWMLRGALLLPGFLFSSEPMPEDACDSRDIGVEGLKRKSDKRKWQIDEPNSADVPKCRCHDGLFPRRNEVMGLVFLQGGSMEVDGLFLLIRKVDFGWLGFALGVVLSTWLFGVGVVDVDVDAGVLLDAGEAEPIVAFFPNVFMR